MREQKRLLTSPHGDGAYGTGEEAKIFAHLWEYYMTGAFGEEIVQYKGFQTTADNAVDEGSRVIRVLTISMNDAILIDK